MNKRNDKNLAEGEVTGHAHRCVGDAVKVFDMDDGTRELQSNGCEVTHEEHKTVVLPAGKFTTFIATERDHAAEEAREVKD